MTVNCRKTQSSITTMPIRDLDKASLISRFNFRFKTIFDNTPAASKKYYSLQKWFKSDPPIINPHILYIFYLNSC